MDKKLGRNDPCPCGSGKKFKQCCWGKEPPKRVIKAKWLNSAAAKEMPNLLERTFKDALETTDKPPVPPGFAKKFQGDPTKTVE